MCEGTQESLVLTSVVGTWDYIQHKVISSVCSTHMENLSRDKEDFAGDSKKTFFSTNGPKGASLCRCWEKGSWQLLLRHIERLLGSGGQDMWWCYWTDIKITVTRWCRALSCCCLASRCARSAVTSVSDRASRPAKWVSDQNMTRGHHICVCLWWDLHREDPHNVEMGNMASALISANIYGAFC